jgi:RNA polymerase sigma-70 factor (ECF subfamily)
MAGHSDDEILSLFRTGSDPEAAFTLLVRKYQVKTYFIIRRMVVRHEDADDIVQNVFIKIWQNLGSFREDSKLFTWIYRIAVNESISFLRQNRLHNLFSSDGMEASMLQSLNDDNFFTGTEVTKKLHEAILKIPPKQRMVFNMRYFDELSYEEMSEITGTSVGALKASYHLASKKIAEHVIRH